MYIVAWKDAGKDGDRGALGPYKHRSDAELVQKNMKKNERGQQKYERTQGCIYKKSKYWVCELEEMRADDFV